MGAPGTEDELNGGKDNGAIYVFFLRRRRWHSFVPDTRTYLISIILPPALFVFLCCSSIIYFFWKFRRKPDEIELMVLKSGVEVTKKPRKRKEKKKKDESKVAPADEDADDF